MLPNPTRDQRRAVVLARWRLRKALLATLDDVCTDTLAKLEAKAMLLDVSNSIVHNRNKHYLAHSYDCENAVSYARVKEMQFLPERRTRTTLGRYIRRNFPDCKVSDEFLEQFTSKVMAKLVTAEKRFRIVEGAAIMDAYRDCIGGESCMTGDSADYVEIYAINPRVVWMVVYDDGDMTARALLWKTNEGHMCLDRIYPNSGRHIDEFKEYARQNGWHMRSSQSYPCGQYFVGLDEDTDLTVTLRIPDPSVYPYMDTFRKYSNSDIDWNDGEITLHTRKGTNKLESTAGEGPGYESGPDYTCCSCGDGVNSDDVRHSESGDAFCESCYNDLYTSCERCGCECSSDDTYTIQRRGYTEQWCESCRDDYATECTQCNEYFRNTDGRIVTVEDEPVCIGCADNASLCHGCGNNFWPEHLTEHGDHQYCSDCLPEEEKEDDESNEQAANANAEAAEVEAVA